MQSFSVSSVITEWFWAQPEQVETAGKHTISEFDRWLNTVYIHFIFTADLLIFQKMNKKLLSWSATWRWSQRFTFKWCTKSKKKRVDEFVLFLIKVEITMAYCMTVAKGGDTGCYLVIPLHCRVMTLSENWLLSPNMPRKEVLLCSPSDVIINLYDRDSQMPILRSVLFFDGELGGIHKSCFSCTRQYKMSRSKAIHHLNKCVTTVL